MAKSGLKHIDVGPELTKTEWESEESHELLHGTSFPSSPVERQLFYRDDEHKWYIYNGTDWVWLGGGSGGGMQVHGNEYHNPDFATEAALASHAAAATGVHGVGASTVESASGAQGKVDTHAGLPDPHTVYIKHSLATAISDFLVASGAGVFVKKTLAEVKTLLNWAADIATHAALTTGIHGVGTHTIGHKIDPRCKVYRATSAQSIPNAVWTKVLYNAESSDIYNEFDSGANSRFTPTEQGTYLIAGVMQIAVEADGSESYAALYFNGGESGLWGQKMGGSSYFIQPFLFVKQFNGTTDYAEIWAWHSDSGNKDLTASITRNYCEIYKIG